MGLKIWTGSTNTPLLDKVFGTVLKSYKPTIPDHKFEKAESGWTPKPDAGGVLLVCGDKLVKQLAAIGVFPKNRSVNSLRGSVYKHESGGVYMATFDPLLTTTEPDKEALMQWDTRLAIRYMQTGTLAPKTGDYKWVSSYQPLIDRINAKYEATGKPVDLAGDLETMGFSPFVPGAQIVSISFTLEEGTAELLYTGPKFADPVSGIDPMQIFAQINWLLTSPKIKSRWANGKFDMSWLKVCWGLYCENFVFDLCLVGSLLDENRSCSLNVLTKVYDPALGGYDDDFNEKYDKGHFENIPPNSEYLNYAGGDTDATQRVSTRLKSDLLAQPSLAKFYVELLHPAARTFEKLEQRGILVDKDKYLVLQHDLQKEIAKLQKDCLSLLPNRLKSKHMDKIEAQLKEGKNPFTPAIKSDYFFDKAGLGLKPKMFSEKTKAISTSAEHFDMFDGEPAAAQMIARLKALSSAEKALQTYVIGFLKHLHTDGRFHPSYMLFHGREDHSDKDGGTVTGRLSAKDPAIQTLPKHHDWAERLRECFPAPPGFLFFEVDFSQGELRVAACVAPDKRMIQAYRDGMDLHAITGALAAHLTYDEVQALKKGSVEDQKLAKHIRQGGKAGNFGLLYGMQAPGFQNYARVVYGVEMSLEEATDFRNRFLYEQWTGLPDYHTRMEKEVKKYKQVVSPLGRVRHLPQIDSWANDVSSKAVRQAINSPIQSTLSDMMLEALTEIENTFSQDDLQTVAVIHDAAAGYVHASKAVDLMEQVTQIMEHLDHQKFGWNPQLTFPADWKLGTNMANMLEKPDYMKSLAA